MSNDRQKLAQQVADNQRYSEYHHAMQSMESNSKQRSFHRYLLEKDREQDIENMLYKEKELARMRCERIEREKSIAREMEELKRQKFKEDKMRQQIRESNQELKELEFKLRAGYVAKGLAAQKAEREALLLQERIDKKKESEKIDKMRQEYEESLQREVDKERQKQCDLAQQLREQFEEHNRKKQKLYEDFLREKIYIDEIIRRINEEQLEEQRQKMLKQDRIREDIETICESQKRFRERQKQELIEENIRIAEYIKEQDQKHSDDLDKKKAEFRCKDELSNKLGSDIVREREKVLEHENLLMELQALEIEQREEEKEREEMEQELRRRIEMRFNMEQSKVDRICKKQSEEQEERQFREEQLKILAERDKLEQLSAEVVRRKRAEHRRAIQASLEERRVERANRIVDMVKTRDADLQEESRRQQLIEEERIKILKEHASALIGFLPRGILRESDCEHLALPPKNKLAD